MAWSDRAWIENAAVRVSMIGFDDGSESQRVFNGVEVESITSDLSSGIDLTRARHLRENLAVAFVSDKKREV